MAQDFSGGIGKHQAMQSQMDSMRKPAPKEMAKPAGGEKQHQITEHGDGSYTSHMDGKEEKHPDHLHMLAHIGHHVTGGDKHHIAHHDGMGMHTHGIHEDGQHEETQEHGSADEAGEGLKQFMGEGEEQEPQGSEGSEESSPLGGM
jgi:hypothetical protein